MNSITLGDVELGTIPRIVAIVGDMLPLESVAGLGERGADILEIRFDLFTQDFEGVCEYVRELRAGTGFPMIGTIRENERTKGRRVDMFRQVLPMMDAVDIEIDAPAARDMVEQARGKVVIVSEHDYDRMPDTETLSRIVSRAIGLGADIVKIAAMALCREDVTRLMGFTEERHEPLVTIAMGRIGTISRIVAPLFGSLFSYAFVNDSVAPGQLSLDELAMFLAKLYPSRSQQP